ncbi:MAG TPA: hypothetical protein VJR89_23900 [Polyangiales bacterium]|nr:hypothetical protein [Polyangiales bacterium]
MRVVWAPRGAHEEADITLAGVFSAKLIVARDGSWSVVGSEGRRSGKAMSAGHAKRAAIDALKELCEASARELDLALRTT